MKLDVFINPNFIEKEEQFDKSLVLMIDVLRASSTICAAIYNGASEVIPIESIDKAVQIYSSLSKDKRFLGGERNGLKPSGFDGGNSPSEYTLENIKGKIIVLTTTNGTHIFQKAKDASAKVIVGFVNISEVIQFVKKYCDENEINQISILCAGNNGRISYEDTLCSGAIIEKLTPLFNDLILTDSSNLAKNLYNIHKDNINEFIYTLDHSKHLKEIGLGEDIEICISTDKYPVVPIIIGNSIKKIE